MRRAFPFVVVAAGLTLAGGAQAQSAATPGQAAGLRYLSWSGRGAVATPAPAAATPDAPRPDLRRPNRVIPHGGFASATAAPAPATAPAARRTLAPAPAPELTPALMAAPAPAAPAPVAPAPVRVDAPSALPAAAPVQPDYVRGNGQPVPTALLAPAPMEQPPVYNEPAADPMAPRRDAPIFRMQQQAQPQPQPTEAASPAGPGAATTPQAEAAPRARLVAEVSNTGERPPAQGARYYSVHRQNGRQPDALAMPDPTYIDALAVTLAETPASQDLAAPDQGPTLIRDRNGNTRAMPAASTGDHQ